MNKKSDNGLRRINWVMAVILYLLSLAAGYYMAAGARPEGTLATWLAAMSEVLKNPLKNYWGDYTITGIIAASAAYLLFGLYYLTTAHNYMRGKEFGTSRFIDPKKLNKELADMNNREDDTENIVMIKVKRRGLPGFFGACEYIIRE